MLMAGLVEALEAAAKAVCDEIPTDDELADSAGDVRAVEVALQKARLKWERSAQEMPTIRDEDRNRQLKRKPTGTRPVAQSQRWEMFPEYETKRSYNTPAILVAVQGVTEWDGLRTLKSLLAADAVRLSWRYTDLKRFLSDHRIPLNTGFEEVDDESGTDQPMIGEVKSVSGMKRVPISPDQLRKPAEAEPMLEPEDGEQ